MIYNNNYNLVAEDSNHTFPLKVVKCVKIPKQDPNNDYYNINSYTIGQLYPICIDCDDIIFIPQENEQKTCFEVHYGIPWSNSVDCFVPVFE